MYINVLKGIVVSLFLMCVHIIMIYTYTQERRFRLKSKQQRCTRENTLYFHVQK